MNLPNKLTMGRIFAIPVFIASVHTKRHTPMQLLGGALIPLAMLIIVDLIF